MVVLPRDPNPQNVEQVMRRANEWAHRPCPPVSLAETGTRIAQARDPVFMRTLERCAEVLDHLGESQNGRTKRDSGTPFAFRNDAAQTNLFREAYRTADAGHPAPQFGFLYAAVATFAGYEVGWIPS